MSHTDHPITDYQSVLSDGAQLVDVREPDEVAEGALDGATNIPVGDVAERWGELDLNKRVVLYCKAGGRSTKAAEILTAVGFGDVVNLEGGMLAYTAANLD